MVKHLPTVQETGVPSLGWEDPLEKGVSISEQQCRDFLKGIFG